MPNQLARSLAFARAVDSPTIRTVFFVEFEMKLVLDTMTSRTGPRSAPNKWISSMTNRATSFTYFRVCQLRLTPSHFSGVVTMTSALITARISGVTSPVNSTTLQIDKNFRFKTNLENFTTNNIKAINILWKFLASGNNVSKHYPS